MSVFAERVRSLVQYASVMQTPADFYRYARLRFRYRGGSSGTPPASIRLRSLGGASVICRASQDVFTFKHTFLVGFHLPPIDLPPNATIVDLGSNVGFTVADLAYRYPAAHILGVEMDERNVTLARTNTARYGERVAIVHAAVWTHDGVVRYTGEADDAFRVETLDSESAGTMQSPARRVAPARRLAGLLDEAGITRVDYMKIDIEGAEGAIFAAPLDWVPRVRSLKVEIHPPATVAACRAALEAEGFSCWDDARHPACLCAARP